MEGYNNSLVPTRPKAAGPHSSIVRQTINKGDENMKKEEHIKVEVDLDKFRNLTDEEIAEKFNKAILPEIIKNVRASGQGQKAASCPVCNPWSYSVF